MKTVVVALIGLGLLLAACSEPAPDPDPEPSPPPTASASPSQRPPLTWPLTGRVVRGGQPRHPVYAVKVENTSGGAPQYGVEAADLVVEQLVEGGVTRLAALYDSILPRRVGHVRSLRDTDIDIAAPAKARVVASGGAPGTLRRVRRAGVETHTADGGAAGFSADPAKIAPYDRLVDLRAVARGASRPPELSPYLTFAAPGEKPSLARPDRRVRRVSVRFSPVATTRWRLRDGRWKRADGFAAGREFPADLLLVLFASVGTADYRDPAGNPVPVTRFSGRGRAVVMIGPNVYRGTWAKPKPGSTLTLSGPDGSVMALPPGRAWIELVPRDDGAVVFR